MSGAQSDEQIRRYQAAAQEYESAVEEARSQAQAAGPKPEYLSSQDTLKQQQLQAIKEGGGVYKGDQEGIPGGHPGLVLFNDPKTGSTLAFPADKPFTADDVRAKLSFDFGENAPPDIFKGLK
jgi:hypothetical protein